jgi:peptide/nickel transport system substrate-binding protein
MLMLASGGSWAQQPTYGGTLRIALATDLTFFNANQGQAPGSHTFWVSNSIFNSLLTLTPPPEGKVIPELAKSWEVLDDGRTYVFHLQEGVKFHDGTDFDAHAAKWNFDRILDPAVNSWVRPYYEDVQQVEAVDTYTLRIRMQEPSGVLPMVLARYFQGVPMASPKAFETYGEDWARHPVGTGPYMLQEWVPGSRAILVKNPTYFKKGLPYLDRLEFQVMKEAFTASMALRTGQIDFIVRVPLQQVPVLEGRAGIQVIGGPSVAPTVALLNMRVKPFDDVRARRAVGGYGINRAKIARLGFDERVHPLVSILPRGVPGAIDLDELYPYRADEAMRLLKELGFGEQNPLKLTILVPNHDNTLIDVAALVKGQMDKIGVQAKVLVLEAIDWVDRVLGKHEFEMVISNWANVADINMRSVSFFKGGQSNYTGIDDPKLEAMARQWRRTLDPEGRERIGAEIQRLVAEQLYWVNMTGYPFFQAYADYVKDYPFYNQAYLFFERVWLDK